jgi:hypothetical protein
MGLFNRKPRGPSREELSAQRAVPARATIVLDVTVDPRAPDIVSPPGYPPQFEPDTVRLEDCRILPSGMWLDQRLTSTRE